MQPMTVNRLRRTTWLCLVAALCALPGAFTAAQQAAPASSAPPASTPATPTGRAMPRPEDLEPGVNTSRTESAPAAAPAASAATSTAPAEATPSVPRTTSATPAPVTSAERKGSGERKGATAKAGGPKSPDRIELDTTDITGNRELPKVLYIVPWKRSDLGDIVGRPVNSLLDEVLQPLDRDVFQRENRYYDGLQPSQGAPKPGTAQGSENKP